MSHWSEEKEIGNRWKALFSAFVYRVLGRTFIIIYLIPISIVYFFYSKNRMKASREYLKRMSKYNKKVKSNLICSYKHLLSFVVSIAEKIAAWNGDIPIKDLIVKTKEDYEADPNNWNTPGSVSGAGFEPGSVFMGKFLIPVKKENNMSTLQLQLYDTKTGKVLRFWNINLAQDDPQIDPEKAHVTYYTGSDWVRPNDPNEATDEQRDSYSLVRNHLYTIGAKATDDYDPDTFILKEGADKFKSLLENAMHYNDYKIMRLKQTVNFHSEEEVATYINAVLQETVKLNDPIHEEITLKHLAKECDISYNTLEKRFQELKSASVTNREKVPVLSAPKKGPTHKDKYSRASLAILYYLLVNDRMVQKYEREGILFPDENARFLASEILYFRRKYGIIKVADFYTYLTDKDNLSQLTSEVLSQELPAKITEQEMDDYFRVIREYNKNREIKWLQKMIKEEMDPMEKARLAEKIKGLRIGEC